MFSIKNYVKPDSLEEAYELNQKKTNRIIGGMLWMKMGTFQVVNALDLSDLLSAEIEETEEEFRIGAMASLRQLELHPGLDEYTSGAMRESVRHIVGVQFRNLATVGGSIWGRFGFSDVLTMFLVLDAYVELYQGGVIPIREFAAQKQDNDILIRVIVKKTPISCVYLSHRNTKTDFPVLTCAMALRDGKLQTAIGARPKAAVLVEDLEEFKDLKVESNMRGSSDYRRHLAKVLTRRGKEQLGGDSL